MLRFRRLAALALTAVLVAACAPALREGPASSTDGDSQQIAATAEADLRRFEAELTAPATSTAPLDCKHVCTLVTNICSLSRRICELAKRDPPAQLGPRCADATTRCQRAERTAAQNCNCPPSLNGE